MSIRGVPQTNIRPVRREDIQGDEGAVHVPNDDIWLEDDSDILEFDFSEILQELASHLETQQERPFVQQIREAHEGFVAVNKDSGEIIEQAPSSQELTESLLSLNYDSENTIIVRCYE